MVITKFLAIVCIVFATASVKSASLIVVFDYGDAVDSEYNLLNIINKSATKARAYDVAAAVKPLADIVENIKNTKLPKPAYMSVGRVAKNVNILNNKDNSQAITILGKKFAVVGDDKVSLNWLKQRLNYLKQHQYRIYIIDAKNDSLKEQLNSHNFFVAYIYDEILYNVTQQTKYPFLIDERGNLRQ